MKILVIGESCRDIFNYGECNRLCPEAPVPIFNSIQTTENGGMALNVKNNIAALNVETDLYTNANWDTITKTRFIDIRTNHMFMRLDCNDNAYERYNINNIRYKDYDAIVISDYNKGFLTKEDITNIGSRHPCVFLDTKKCLGSWCESITYIKDVSGAGDSFIAGLVVKYIENNDIIDAIRFANCCATKVVQKKGVSIV